MEDEVWVGIKDHENTYQVSSYGRVRSLDRTVIAKDSKVYYKKGKILSIKRSDVNDYIRINLYKEGIRNTTKVHKLVAFHFIPNPKNFPYINHINGNKHDNKASNLEWVTPSENMLHAHRIGIKTAPRGSKSGNSKLTESEVIKIKKMLKDGKTQVYIAEKFNISQVNVSSIKLGRIWGYLEIK